MKTKRAKQGKKATKPVVIRQKGYDALWLWFGLSRASFCVLPRVLMHDMPDKWQGQMAKLLNEYQEAHPNMPDDFQEYVTARKNGRFVRLPDWLCNYRHPNRERIKEVKTLKQA